MLPTETDSDKFTTFFTEIFIAMRGVKEPKRKRQYEHIKESELKRGRPEKVAKRIAAATVQKTRSRKGEAKSSRSGSSKKS
jgi:hypothetical protein